MDNVAINLGRRFDLDRRKSRLSEIRETTADGIQRFNQVRNRTLAHSGNAVQYIFSAAESQRRRERTHRGAGVPEKKICLLDRKVSAAAFHLHNRTVVGDFKLDAESLQCSDHHFRIFGRQQILQLGCPLRERSQKQGSIGDALRAR